MCSKTVISPSAESVDVDSQSMPLSEDESRGASSEAHLMNNPLRPYLIEGLATADN